MSHQHKHNKIIHALRQAERWLRAMGVKNPRLKTTFDEAADRDVAAAGIIEELENELEKAMRAQAAIDKLEARIDDLNTAVAARDRKIVSLSGQLTTAQANALDDADLADITRVEGQTFNPIPAVDDGSVTPPPTGDGTTVPPVTPAA